MKEEKVDVKVIEEELPICPACLGEKYWPFADVGYGAPCPICRATGRVTMKLAIERGW